MSGRTQEDVVVGQYATQAQAYLTSAVHASGEDLAALAALARGHGGARVLDMGTGGGHVAYAIAPHVAQVVAYDITAEMLAVVERSARERGFSNIVTLHGPAERVPSEDNGFDLVVSRYSAHHWRDFDAGLREAARVAKPGATVAMVDTITPGNALLDTFLQSVELLRDPSHVRNRTRAEWEASAAAAGLLPRRSEMFRIRLDFASWVARMRTPALHVEAIRSLQAGMAEPVRRHFAVEADGSFCLDVSLFVFSKPE